MNPFRSTFLLFLLLSGACAHAEQPAAEESAQRVNKASPEQINAMGASDLPAIELTGQLLYEFLLGDIAAQRGQPELAAQTYLALAKRTRDLRVARRAAQLAYESRQPEIATDAFQLWLELEPTSPAARQMLLSLQLSRGRLQDARSLLVSMLQAEPAQAGHVFASLYPLLARLPDKSAVLDWLIEVTHAWPAVAEGHWAVAQAAAAAGRHDLAEAEAQRAAALKPDWDAPVLLEADLLMKRDPEQALKRLREFLATHPDSREVRLYYARALLNQKAFAAAREEFGRLQQERPDHPDLAFAVALISLQMGDYTRAEEELKQALSNSGKDESTVHYYLAQLNEAHHDDANALLHYRQVKEGMYAYPARLREVALLGKAGDFKTARKALQGAVPHTDQQRIELALIDAQLLRADKQYAESFRVLDAALAQFPNHPDLLYQTAMAAEKLRKHELFEQLIRKLIGLEPNNAHAYNALGYSLMERNIRLKEAMELVEKAYELAPDDAAIIDSVGWGHYLLGNPAKSLEFLRRAHQANPDPEIAAHLGEVLWKQGKHEEARQVWAESIRVHPDNEVLQATMKRFLP